ncbi:MAG: amidophosphoribosyltransferase [Vicinamibacteria bacterium]|jgi:amidophosphoribosyltransferase|nr:amidophosphoribosyltransferase [Vicinamibacteria bacterium]
MGGFFGVASKEDCVADVFYGTDYHSHLGTSRGGMVVRGDAGYKRNIHDITNAPFRTKFEEDLPKHHGRMGMGVISDLEDQPLLISSHHGYYAIVTVGRIENHEALVKQLLAKRGTHFTELRGNEVNPTELVAMMINQEDSYVSGLRRVQTSIAGSCSVLILTDHGLYAARDRLGRTPIALGRKEGAFAATLETCALPNLDYEVERHLGPGEIVRVTAEGVETLAPAGEQMQICSFLWIYYGYPASEYEGLNTEVVRNRCGAALAINDRIEVDMVAGIPDSGVGHAIGYASQRRLPYRRPFVKYTPTWPRSFMPQEQRVRDLVARMKLIPVRELIDGQRMLFCEDSIVRGTQLRDIIMRLFDHGAREIHMRPACPPLVFGCKFLNFSRSRSIMDLAARKAILELEGDHETALDEFADAQTDRYARMVEVIRRHLGLSTLQYQKLPDMIRAISLPAEKLCTYCWDGCERFS